MAHPMPGPLIRFALFLGGLFTLLS